MANVLHIQNLSLGYPGLTLCSELSFNIDSGATLAVVGANGSGKSTFIKTLLALHKPTEGQLQWSEGRPQNIGYLAQMTEFDRTFPLRVKDVAAMGQWKNFGLMSGLERKQRERVTEALNEAGVLEIADQPLHTLSGGQLQRTLFARVIMQDASLILLDEPFAAVDQKTEAHLMHIINHWREEGRAVVMVLHDLSSVLDHCTHALLLGNGKASHGLVQDVLSADNLVQHGYFSQSQAQWMFGDRASQRAGSDV
ncbi:MAG: ABC transporter ATP-binding protein [Pseudomonadota bacterium]